MADVPYFELIIPIVVTSAISAVFMLGRKIAKTSDDMLTSTQQINHLTDKLDAGLAMANKVIEKSESTHDDLYDEIEEVCKRVDKIDSELRLVCYRLEKLESKYNGNKSFGNNNNR